MTGAVRLLPFVVAALIPGFAIPAWLDAQQPDRTATRCDRIGDPRAYCEDRDETLAFVSDLDVDSGGAGGIRVTGWDRGEIHLGARVSASAATIEQARALAQSVRVTTSGGRIRAEGPPQSDRERWWVAFELDVPRDIHLVMNARNGGLALDHFRGTAEFHTVNGGISLRDVGGDLKGRTHNGGLHILLDGPQWDGVGLDVETVNGGVHLSLPDNYSADLETGTTNGRISIDFPVDAQAARARHLQTRIGAGGPKIRAMTTNGGVTVLRQ